MVGVLRSITNYIISRYDVGGNYFPTNNCLVKTLDNIKVKSIVFLGLSIKH
jgi:hypothetical protein